MPLLTADLIFDGYTFLPSNSVLHVSDEGIIQEIITGNRPEDVIKYKGLLMPGMINAHCHLELSHLKKRVGEKSGLVDFLLSILSIREKFSVEEKIKAIESAEAEMLLNGIVAVGDISNTTDSLFQKAKGKLIYHTFVECFGLRADKAVESFSGAKKILAEFSQLHNSSIVLHAPYSISRELIALVDNDSTGKITTIHNQESADENELFLNRSGDFLKLFKALHFDPENFITENKNSIQTYLPKFLHQEKIILVHNTFTSKEDIRWAHSLKNEIYWCVCPNANLFIENSLADIDMMIHNDCNIVIGTDSLASNHSLSIWEEIRTIHKHMPGINIETILKWATSNGARALGMSEIGSFEKGKKPGIIHISAFTKVEKVPEGHVTIRRIV